MTNIRDYMKKKETSGSKDIKKQLARHRLTVFYRIALGVLVIAAIGFLIYIQAKNRVYTTYQVVSEIAKTTGANATDIAFGQNIISYSKDGASCMDINGNAIWNQTFEMQNPLVDVRGNMAAFGDYNGHTVFLMDNTGVKGEIDTGMPIRSMCVSANGLIAVVLDDSSITWIKLFDGHGNILSEFKTTMKLSGYPVDLAISGNGVLISVSYLYVDSGSIKSKIAFYNLGSVGQNKVDRLVGAYEYADTIAPQIEFMNDNTIFMLADNRLVVYKGNQIPVHQAEMLLQEEIQSSFYSEKYIALLFLSMGGENKYRLDIYNENCTLLQSIFFNLQYKDIIINGENIIIYNESECEIYNISGVRKYQGSFQQAVRRLIPTAKPNKFTGITEDKIQKIELR